ncbi:PH domain-containing protein [Haloterrigena salifodinae]|uniref:PH domain-containing protein n=1 Tax=Haloterrigena salifodinae TaxID=2675099 RepID=A0A8T8E6N6_9EURY|nr:PH domain-containing protein [Haloterrigena salifodinae]QRV16971.1 PH domain-containing protein [Haloterrigena salifodinae]
MSSDSRLHDASIFCRAVDDIDRSVIVVVGLLFVYRDGIANLRYLLPFLLLYFLAAALWESLYWYRFTYRVTDGEEISIRSGVLHRRHRTVPVDRIERVSVLESPVSRLFGLTELHCETAGTRDKSEIKLRYVDPDTANRLRQTLESTRRDEQRDGQSTATQLYRISLRQLLAYSLFRIHHIPIIFAVGTVISIVLLPIEASTSFTARVVMSVRAALPGGLGLSKWGVLILLAIGAGWTVGAIRLAIRMYGFQLSRNGDTLYRRHGLVSRVEEEISIENVQLVRYSDNPLLRSLGQTQLDAQTAGGSEILPFDSRTSLVPLARRADVEEIARQIFPVAFEDSVTIPKRARRRYFVRYLLIVLLAVGGTIIAREYNTVLAMIPLQVYLLLAAAAPVAAHIRWATISYVFGSEYLRICGGFWWRREYIIPYSNIQRHTVSQSILQRRHSLSTLRVDTAAYPLSIGAIIPDMDTETATKFGERLKQYVSSNNSDGNATERQRSSGVN